MCSVFRKARRLVESTFMGKSTTFRKREPACERTIRELVEAVRTYPFPEMETAAPPPAPPGFGMPKGLRRMLNHLEETGRLYAYNWLLSLYLLREGVKVPIGWFHHNPVAPGSGRQKDPAKIELGYQAFCLQLQKALPNSDFSHEQFSAACDQHSSWAASEIAKELIPAEYAKNREAARKKIEEAIALAKRRLSGIPEQIGNQFAAQNIVNNLVTPLLSGDFPFEE